MKNKFFAIGGILLSFSLPVFADFLSPTAILTIVPSVSSVNVVAPATATVTYTVTNNLSIAAQNISVTPGFNSNNNVITVTKQSDNCTPSRLSAGASCTFQAVIQAASNDIGNTILSPRVCVFSNAACSIPSSANRIPVSVTKALGVPSVSGLSPTFGTTAGGSSVTITGTNLSGATAVKFGLTAATSFVVNSATQITATSPAETSGTVDVTVTTPGGTSIVSSADQFTYLFPITGSPSLMLLSDSPGLSNQTGTGSITINNVSSTTINGITANVAGTQLTTGANTCTGGVAANASCTISFTSSNVTTDASGNETITVSGTGTNTLTIPVAALGVIVMSPPFQSGVSANFLLVQGCLLPEILEIVNNSSSAISGINASKSAGLSATSIANNYCSNVTLGQNQVCMIQISSNTATNGNTGTFTISNATNTQTIAVSAAVEAKNANGDLPVAVGAGQLHQGDTIFFSDTTTDCNLIKVVSTADALSMAPVPWAISAQYQHNAVPFPGTSTPGAQNLNQGQPNTISITAAEQTQSQNNTDFAAGGCVNYTETNGGTTSSNWYLPSICELGGSNIGTGISAGCTAETITDNIYTSGDLPGGPVYWSSTEEALDINDAWFQNFGTIDQDAGSKDAFQGVRCARAFTD